MVKLVILPISKTITLVPVTNHRIVWTEEASSLVNWDQPPPAVVHCMNVLCCSCWSSCRQSGLRTGRHLHRWWCSRPPGPVSPGRHTWPRPPRQPSPTAHPGSPACLHTAGARTRQERVINDMIRTSRDSNIYFNCIGFGCNAVYPWNYRSVLWTQTLHPPLNRHSGE